MRPTNPMLRRDFFVRILVIGGLVVMTELVPAVSRAQMDKVKASMVTLKERTAKLGAPRIKGTEVVAGRDAPALYFGSTRMNNFFDVVDEVVKEHGGTATLFVKSGEDFVRVATNVQRADGSRAIGTVLDPAGPAYAMIKTGKAYYGDAVILGKLYVTGYDPIRDESGAIIGIYYVGYLK